MKILAFCFGFILVPIFMSSQDISRLELPFYADDEISYTNALTGGFDAPQYQEIDLDLDGVKDLLVFDRKGSVFRTFLYDESSEFPYIYAPEYEAIFPNVQCWLHVIDYNNDGVDDLFTCGVTDPVTGIEVWTGIEDNGSIRFEAFDHYQGAFNIIYYESGSDHKQLYVGNNGIPAVTDVDNDGDIDILAFQPSGGYLYYFQNQSQERGFGNDSLIYAQVDECWGKFYEGGLVPDIVLNDNSMDCAQPSGLTNASTRHEGITITAFDKNQDGLKDLLIGEVSSKNLIFVENGGTIDNAFATYKETDFPSEDVPVDMQIFVGTFLVDVDKDGRKDILVSPNSQFGKNTINTSFYKNIEVDSAAEFNLIEEDWLVGESLDFGTDSYPAFCDYNADGLTDIVVSSYGLIGLEGGVQTRLYLFENRGSVDDASYHLVDDNYLNFLEFSDFDKSYVPSFGDLDGDGDTDIIMGSLSGDLIYIENTGGEGQPYDFVAPVFDFFELNTENNTLKVTIADINQDGLGDIVVGGRNSYTLEEGIGSLKYFENVGTMSNPIFSNDNFIKGLGSINVKDAGSSKVSASASYYSEGEDKLMFVGNEVGRVAVYKVNSDGAPFELLFDDLLGLNLGRRITIDVQDIDNDGFLELVAGNERGGLNIFNTVVQATGLISSNDDMSKATSDLILFPNPVNQFLSIKGQSFNSSKYMIFSNIGQRVKSGTFNDLRLNVSELNSGIYHLRLFGDDKIQTAKFIKL